jgi:hypothetical protein
MRGSRPALPHIEAFALIGQFAPWRRKRSRSIEWQQAARAPLAHI